MGYDATIYFYTDLVIFDNNDNFASFVPFGFCILVNLPNHSILYCMSASMDIHCPILDYLGRQNIRLRLLDM
jgi:glycopeptide antibiotics resistance protein